MISGTPTRQVRAIVKGYFGAWTCGDVEGARRFLSDRFAFQGSIDTFQSVDQFLDALRGFQRMLKTTSLMKEFYSSEGAALLYDCITDTPAGTIRTAEYLAVREGKIFEILLVFDATRLRRLMGR